MMIKVIFVCMGNICRSPTAEGVFRQMVRDAGMHDRISTDSAGTHAYHVGNLPDARAQATARARGIDISDLRARQVCPADFDIFDYVLAMDEDNYQILRQQCSPEHLGKLRLFMEFAEGFGVSEVPDPYYGGPGGFEQVFDMVEAASRGLLLEIQSRLG